jgi:uncharacterized protein YdiU (UPF0061 family)
MGVLSGYKQFPKVVRDYLDAKINIWLNQDMMDRENKRLCMLKDTMEELAEKSREKRLKKIAETEQKLAECEKELEHYKQLYNKVEKQAKEKLVEMARNMVDRAGGEGCFDNMVELRNKRIKGEEIQDKKRQEYKELDPNVTERLVWAAEILQETEDNPF